MYNDLHRFHARLEAALDARLSAECALTAGRFEVLDVIGREGTCRVTYIAEELGITWGGASKLVDRLEAARLCKRLPNPEDGRSSLIEISAAGKRTLTKATRIVSDELELRIGTVLAQRPLDQLSTSLRRLRESTTVWDVASASA
jgi:DNA-binding MarR family transcriptional regulator